MIHEYSNYTPTSLRHALGGVDHTNTADLLSALMVLCDMVQWLQRRVRELEDRRITHALDRSVLHVTELHDQVQPEVRE